MAKSKRTRKQPPKRTPKPNARSATFASLAQYARYRGVSRQRIQVLDKQGKIKRDAAGRILRKESDAAILEAREQTVQSNPARDEKDLYAGKMAKLRYEREAGLVVPISDVETTVFQAARAERQSWINWVPEVAPQLAAELGVDTPTFQVLLDRAVRRHLESLSEISLEALHAGNGTAATAEPIGTEQLDLTDLEPGPATGATPDGG